MRELIMINDLMSECGHGYMDESGVNNSYNCNNPECEEFEYVKGDKRIDEKQLLYKYIQSRYKTKPIKKRLRKKLFKKFINPRTISEDKFMELLGLRKVYKCYSWTCPIAYEADLDSMKELDEDLYKEHLKYANGDGTLNDDWLVYDR